MSNVLKQQAWFMDLQEAVMSMRKAAYEFGCSDNPEDHELMVKYQLAIFDIVEANYTATTIGQGEPVGYVRKYALEHLKNTQAHTVIDANPRTDDDIALYTGGYEQGKKDGWEACETCHGIIGGKVPTSAPTMLTEQAPCDIPEGYVLVPIEPTPEMIIATMGWYDGGRTYGEQSLIGSYKLMLSAVPKHDETI